MKTKMIFETSVFSDKCPDCGAGISYVQFGGPRIGYDEYTGFQYIKYECHADYYFDNRTEILSANHVLCPSICKDCKICGKKVGIVICSRIDLERLKPFCSDQCAINWAIEKASSELTI